ncbi:MAG: two-component regulator propeller domain-containing protein [Chloroflexota bacterium]
MFKRIRALQPLVIVLLLAVFLHVWAVALLPEDFDEPVYLQAAFDYAENIRQGDWQAVVDDPGIREHPPLVRLLYAGVITLLGDAASWINAFYASRALSAAFGILAIMVIALTVDPLAGGLLAVHTLAVKYTSQVYLEAVPHAMMVIAILAMVRSDRERRDRWFWLSAVALGIAAASKYAYLPVAILVLGYLLVFEKKTRIANLLGFGGLAVLVFFGLNVTLWHDTLGRLLESLFYHVQYSQGAHVQEVGYPWFQPFIWIFTSSPAQWHPQVFFYLGFDGLIAILAFAGLPREWKERRWLVVWLIFGILFLLVWPTKWPQYSLSVTPAICIMAAGTGRRFYRWARDQENYWEYLKEMLPRPGKWLWISLAAFSIFIATVYLSAAIRLAIGQVGWSQLTRADSPLPSNTVNALLPLEDGRILIATDQGLAIWVPAQTADLADEWTIYNQGNSPLAGNRVLSLGQDSSGTFWIGTATGLNRYDGINWTTFTSADIGLADDTVFAIAIAADDRVFIGTPSGASTWDGVAWEPLPQLQDQVVFSLAISPQAGDTLWAGTVSGTGRLELQSQAYSFYSTGRAVRSILVDTGGQVWIGTSGGGLAFWQAEGWQYFNTASSELPYNTVNSLAEIDPGVIWVATSLPSEIGGVVAEYDGTGWRRFLTTNSGASGAEPLVIVRTTSNQVWIGTRSHGIDIYNLGR